MDVLSNLFGSASKVKIMRLFLFNPGKPFDNEDIAQKANVDPVAVRKITKLLHKVKLIKTKSFSKPYKKHTKKGLVTRKKRVKGWILDEKFTYLNSLSKLLVNTNPYTHKELLGKLKSVGKVKLVIVSGAFIQEWDTRVDILVVGEKLSKSAVAKAMRIMESEIGKELRYSFFETDEFNYRLDVYDKLIRDILDFPHEIVLDKLDFEGSPRALPVA